MPITTTGRDIALARNLGTGKYNFKWAADGNPTFTNSCEHPILARLYWHLAQWFADTNGMLGSRLYTIKHDLQATKSQLEEYSLAALAPMVTDGRLLAPPALSAVATRLAPGKYDLQIYYTTANGQSGRATYPVQY